MAKTNNNFQFMNGIDSPQSWQQDLPSPDIEICDENLNLFFKTMFERQEVWYKRFILKQKAPWTEDQFLANNKFTNVYRELDRASQWLIKNVYLDNTLSEKDLIWKIICFRFFNQPDTFDLNQKIRVDLPKWKDFNVDKMYEQVIKVRESGRNPWHVSYMMNMAFLPKTFEPERGLFKDHAYINHLMVKVHQMIPNLFMNIQLATKPEQIITLLETLPAVSTFQSHEFFIDFCYVNKYTARKWFKFNENDYTNVGPGASLGIRLIFPSTLAKDQKQRIYDLRDISKEYMIEISKANSANFKYISWNKAMKKYDVCKEESSLSLHQIEMFLCEFSKYWKMALGKGKQRSKFKPSTYQTKLY